MAAERAVARTPRGAHVALRTALVVLALLAGAGRAAGALPPSARELQIEAAFLVNFVRYTEWPAQSLQGPEPWVVTVIGSNEVAAAMAPVFAAAGSIDGRRIEMRHLDPPHDAHARPRDQDIADRLRGSHVVFVQADAAAVVGDVVAAVRGLPILTVSDADGFVAAGGMLGLVHAGSHLRFEAGPAAIRAADLQLSAKVLKLAAIVPGGA